MLILTRKVGESILLGDEIEIFLTDINKTSARIGIKAPRDLPVYRKEVYERIMEENRSASVHTLDTEHLDKLNELISHRLGG